MKQPSRFWLSATMLACLSACGGDGDDRVPISPEILSSPASMVSGGDALVSIPLPSGLSAQDVKLELNGQDISSQLQLDSATGSLRAVVTGMTVGANTLAVSGQRVVSKSITVTNYPAGGPIFSGPQLQPWVCTTDAAGLGAAQDAQCNAPSKFDYFYMSKATGTFESYDPASPPASADIASTTTDQGVTMDFIVRRETGTVNRAIYQTAVLFDPRQGWTALAPQAGWNRKVFVPLLGGFGHYYSQGLVDNVLYDVPLKKGFMVSKTTFLQAASNMDWVRGAESLMMLKERITERYGTIRYTFSAGSSGGSMLQVMIANNYPGLLQGLIPSAEYADYWGSPAQEVPDCISLVAYFRGPSASLWANAQERIAVFGHLDEQTCNFYSTIFTPALNPSSGAARGVPSPHVPASLLYNALTNPGGARGVQEDYQVNYFGRRPQSRWSAQETAAGFGFAVRLYDNVGVQYGLKALAQGSISAEQFVDLNEKVGSVDLDGKLVPTRAQQDPEAAAIVYRAGFINDAARLDRIPMLALRRQDVDPTASHSVVNSFILNDTMVKTHGSLATRALWIIPNFDGSLQNELALTTMDRWLAAIDADKSSRAQAEKVAMNRPADVSNGCWAPGTTAISLSNQTKDMAQCTTWFPVSATPRIVSAGGDLGAARVSKCQLKPLVRTDYSVPLSDGQWARLQAVFPAGVCDWTKADKAQVPSVPWLGFSAGPGGVGIPGMQ